MTTSIKFRWPSAFRRTREEEDLSGGIVTIHPSDQTSTFVNHEPNSLVSSAGKFSWWNRSNRNSTTVDETKLGTFQEQDQVSPVSAGGGLGIYRGGLLSPLSPSSVCPSTRVVLSRGIIEYPDVELRDTVDLDYPIATTNFDNSGSTDYPLLPPYPATDFGSTVEQRKFLPSPSDPGEVYTIMGRLRSGVGESK